MSNLKFFLNAKGGSLAFLKEMDSPDWENSVFFTVSAIPYAPTIEHSLPLYNSRVSIILIKPSDPGAIYSLRVMGYMDSLNIPDWYLVDEGIFTELSGNYAIGINAQLVDRLSVAVDVLSGGTLSIEVAPIPWEDTV